MRTIIKGLIAVAVLAVCWYAVTVRSAFTTYYVKKTGSNANSCAAAQDPSTPKLTINAALACLTEPGDTLRIGQGTYVENIIFSSLPVSGTAANPITITNIIGENRPLLQPTEGCYGIQINKARNYIIYDNLDINGQNLTSCGLPNGSSLVSAGSDDGPTGVVFRRMEWAYSQSHNVINGDQILVEYVVVHHAGWYVNTLPPPVPGTNGFYGSKLRNSIVRHSVFHNNMCNGIRVYNSGSNVGISANNNVIEWNYAHDNGSHVGLDGTSTCNAQANGQILAEGGAGFLIADDNNTLQHNIAKNPGVGTGGRCIYVYPSSGVTTQSKVYNNTCTGFTWGIVVAAGVQSTIVKNNWSFGNGNGTTDNYINAGTGTVASNNRTTGSQTDCAPSSAVFSLKSGSPCIDGGVDVGLPYNGSVPDIGAFETFTFASCEVPVSAPNTVQVAFHSNVGLLGDVLTTFTVRLNAGSNPLSGSPSKIGDTIISLPVSTSYLAGDASDLSWSSGGLTDNARIGGTLNQPFVQTLTNQSCTNRAGGSGAHVFTLAAYNFRGLGGPENTTDIRSVENVASFEVVKGGAVRVRVAVTCTVANCPPTAFYLMYSMDGVNYSLVQENYDVGNIGFCGAYYIDVGVENGASTTNQLTTSGTFVPGGVLLHATAIPTISGLLTGYKTELEYCISWDVDALGTYWLRLTQQNGEAVVSAVTPVISLINPMGSVF